MNQEQFLNTWERKHSRYEKDAYRIFSRAFRQSARNIPWDFLNENNYEVFITGAINTDDITNAYAEVYSKIGIEHGTFTGKSINSQIKIFTESAFLNEFQRTIIQWLFNNAGTRITSVTKTYAKWIISEIAKGLENNISLPDIVNQMLEKIGNPRSRWYRNNLLRIARTETTAAANHGATVATQISGVVTDKIWISARDERTRRPPKSRFNHFAMNGTKVPQNEKFNVNGDLIDFPGDPKGQAGNIINCRCASAVVPRRDSDGNIIFN